MSTLLAWIGHNLVAVGGLLLGLVLCARLVHQRRRPSVTFAWILVVLLLPYVGVPLYVLFGGRKLRRFEAPEPEVDLAASEGIEGLLIREGGRGASGGNHIDWLLDGQLAFQRLLETLASARRSIRVSIFLVHDDATGQAVVQALAERAAAGVEVHFLLDDLGSMHARAGLLDPLRSAGARVARFLPVLPIRRRWSVNLRNHRKLAVIDGAVAWTGGMNFGAEYLGSEPNPQRWIDGSMLVRGPAVADLDEVFVRDWRMATGETLAPSAVAPSDVVAGDARLQVVASGPDSPEDALSDAVLAAIAQARERVWLLTPYFIPDEPLARLLALQARLGRDVRLLLPERSNHRLADLARTRFLTQLGRAGVHVNLIQGRMVHAKAMVFDHTTAVFGTANLDLRSLYLNFELSVFMSSPDEVARLADWMQELERQAHPFEERPPRLVERTLADLANLAAPLL